MFPTSPRGSEPSSTLPPPWAPPHRVPFNNFKTPNGGTHPKCFTGYQKRTRKAHPKTPESTRSHPTAPEMLVKLITFAPERHPKHFEHYHFCIPRRPKSAAAAEVVKTSPFTTSAVIAAEVAKTGRLTTSVVAALKFPKTSRFVTSAFVTADVANKTLFATSAITAAGCRENSEVAKPSRGATTASRAVKILKKSRLATSHTTAARELKICVCCKRKTLTDCAQCEERILQSACPKDCQAPKAPRSTDS